MTTTIETPATADIQTSASGCLAVAQACVITTQSEAESANAALRDIKAMSKQVTERFEPAVTAANRAHKELTKLRASLLDPLERAEKIIKSKLGEFMMAEQRKADEARRAAEREAQARAEEERLAHAASLKRQGRTLEAAAELDAPVVAAPVLAPPAAPKIAGTSVREMWTGRVDSLLALVQHVAANPSLIGLLKADQSAIDALARASKHELRIPGLTAVCNATVSVR